MRARSSSLRTIPNIAKVEGLLKEDTTENPLSSASNSAHRAGNPGGGPLGHPTEARAGTGTRAGAELEPGFGPENTTWVGEAFDINEHLFDGLIDEDAVFGDGPVSEQQHSSSVPSGTGLSGPDPSPFPYGELLGLGQFEALPPNDLIEEL